MPDHAPLTREQRAAIVKAAEAVALTGNLMMLTPEQVLGYEAAVAEAEKTVPAAMAEAFCEAVEAGDPIPSTGDVD